MESEFVNESEQNYLLSKAELLRIEKRINETAEIIKTDFGHEEQMTQSWTGVRIEIPIKLDELTLEKLESIIPKLKIHLAEYQRLRLLQHQTQKRIDMFKNSDFEVTLKNS